MWRIERIVRPSVGEITREDRLTGHIKKKMAGSENEVAARIAGGNLEPKSTKL